MFTSRRPMHRILIVALVVPVVLAVLGAPLSLALPPATDSRVVISQASVAATATSSARGVAERAAAAAAVAPAVPPYDHVMVVIMENHSAENIMANPAAPYI